MKVSEMKYSRPDTALLLSQLEDIAKDIKTSDSAEKQLELFNKFEQLTGSFSTMAVLSEIRSTIDTRDTFYEQEQAYFDENSPAVADKQLDVFRALLASPYKAELMQALPPILFEKMEVDVKSASNEILPLMSQENALCTEYQKLYAGAQISFDGGVYTISQLAPFKQSADRAVRKAAYEAEGAWFDANRDKLDDIYDKLVKNRTEQAKKLGYDSYSKLGVIRMRRIGYGIDEINAYHENIKRDIVPIISKLKAMQYERTGIGADAKFYDDSYRFADGNPVPHGTPDEILAAGKRMYHELSPETSAFIDEMFAADAFDVLSKPGKAPGGYCTGIHDYKQPFIFSNFNATADDVDVLTHEAGHAFAAYVAYKKNLPSSMLEELGMESCEIHSMSMEFLTADYHELFFGDDTAKYELYHAEDSIGFLPYGTMVDEFQHKVYDNRDMTPQQRNETWAALEKQYRPWLDFDALPFYGRGSGWQRQLHIYLYPFYYIDYCFAQTVALQFFTLWLEDKSLAWQRYLTLVSKAGTLTYPQLVASAGFQSPFENGTMKAVGEKVGEWCETENEKLKNEK